jgi:two-component system, OmpR family, sensor histidine kinase RstB
MHRLYFRVIIGVLAVLVASVFLPRIVFRWFPRNDYRPRIEMGRHGSGAFIRERLDAIPAEQLPEQIEILRKVVDYPIQLVDSSDTSVPSWVRSMESPGGEFHPGGPPLNEPGRMSYIPLPQAGKVLIMGPMPEPGKPDNTTLAVLIGLTLLMSTAAVFIIVAPVARNLKRLEIAAGQFGAGDLTARAPVKSRDTVGSVSKRFNQMAESIERMIQRERQLLQSVSHELRTPIARIRFSLDMMAGSESKEDREARAKEIDTEIAEIDELVGELLDYNRYHSDSVSLKIEGMEVYPLLFDVEQRLQDFRTEINIEITSSDDAHCTMFADRLLLRRAVQNLVMNALRYAKAKVVIRYGRTVGGTIIEICDDGPGIPKEERAQILKPFYRLDQSRAKGTGGVGLGLAIVSRIVELHHGKLAMEDSESGGAKFVTFWPDVQPAG